MADPQEVNIYWNRTTNSYSCHLTSTYSTPGIVPSAALLLVHLIIKMTL